MKAYELAVKPASLGILLFAGCFLFPENSYAEELRESTTAPVVIAPAPGETGDFDMPESTETQKPQPVEISDRMMRKMRELEKAAEEEKGRDDAALERLGARPTNVGRAPTNGNFSPNVSDFQP